LLEHLHGRRWVLRSKAVSLPNGLDGNIFHTVKGYALPFFVKDSLFSYKYWNTDNPKIIIMLGEDEKVNPELKWQSVNFEGEKLLSCKRFGNELSVEIPEFCEAGILLIEKII
jgi:hypothetical protein